jgi:hypothetical protein
MYLGSMTNGSEIPGAKPTEEVYCGIGESSLSRALERVLVTGGEDVLCGHSMENPIQVP